MKINIFVFKLLPIYPSKNFRIESDIVHKLYTILSNFKQKKEKELEFKIFVSETLTVINKPIEDTFKIFEKEFEKLTFNLISTTDYEVFNCYINSIDAINPNSDKLVKNNIIVINYNEPEIQQLIKDYCSTFNQLVENKLNKINQTFYTNIGLNKEDKNEQGNN